MQIKPQLKKNGNTLHINTEFLVTKSSWAAFRWFLATNAMYGPCSCVQWTAGSISQVGSAVLTNNSRWHSCYTQKHQTSLLSGHASQAFFLRFQDNSMTQQWERATIKFGQRDTAYMPSVPKLAITTNIKNHFLECPFLGLPSLW